ncbi:MAG: hypothetical protein ACPG4T_09650 [Nannocystaceae bacterium]
MARSLALLTDGLGQVNHIAEVINDRYADTTSIADLLLDAEYEHRVEGGWVLGSADGPEVNWEEFRELIERYIPKLDEAKPLTAVALLGALIDRYKLRAGAIGIAMALYAAFRALEKIESHGRKPTKVAAEIEHMATVFPTVDDATIALQVSGFEVVGRRPNSATMLLGLAFLAPLSRGGDPLKRPEVRRLQTLGKLVEDTAKLVSDCLGDREVSRFVALNGLDSIDELPPESESKYCRCRALVVRMWRQRRVRYLLVQLMAARPNRRSEMEASLEAWADFVGKELAA